MMLRPVRIFTTDYLVYPQIAHLSKGAYVYSAQLSSGSIHIQYNVLGSDKQLRYRPEFGFFFLISMLVLVVFDSKKRGFHLLFTVHLAATLLAYFMLIVGAFNYPAGFMSVDIISGYLTPAFSLAIVSWVVVEQRNRE